MKIGKTEFTKQVAVNANTSVVKAEEMVDAVFSTLRECLSEGMNVTIPGFGRFYVYRSQPRNSTNPRTHEEIVVPAYNRAGIRYSTQFVEELKNNENLTKVLEAGE